MPQSAQMPIDPVFAGIAKAIYGDVNLHELLAKMSPGSSDLHVDGAAKKAQREKKLAVAGLGTAGISTVAAGHSVKATYDEHVNRMAEAGSAKHEAKLTARKVKVDARNARGGSRATKALKAVKIKPTHAAAAAGLGWAGLHVSDSLGDTLASRAHIKNYRKANQDLKQTQVAKAVRLRPLNAGSLAGGRPSLRAKRPKANPLPGNPQSSRGLFQPVVKGVIGGVRSAVKNANTASQHAVGAARSAEESAKKVQQLIPSKRTAALIGAGAIGSVGATSYLGSSAGTYHGATKAAKKQAKLKAKTDRLVLDATPRPRELTKSVTWVGEISKVDAERRQVFGWASVSAIDGQPVVDLQGDIVPIDEIEKSAYRYVLESRKGGDMHRRVAKSADAPLHTADLIESFVVTPEKLAKMGLQGDALPHGWWIGFKVNDEDQWNLVKSGQRSGFSIHGKGVRVPAEVSKSLAERADQALHPPGVKLKAVKSAAVSAMGYQPQTRRLAYEMRSRPGEPYVYKVKRKAGAAAMDAKSKGAHFATKVRGKAKRSEKVGVVDRARLFVKPDMSKAAPLPVAKPAATRPATPAATAAVKPKQPTLKPLAAAKPAAIQPPATPNLTAKPAPALVTTPPGGKVKRP